METTESVKVSTEISSRLKVAIIGAIPGILIWFFLPAVNGLTEAGVRMLAVFVSTIVWWVAGGTGWTSWLALVAVIGTGLINGNTVFMTVWGNQVCAIMFSTMVMVIIMTERGIMSYIAQWFLTRKVVLGRPIVFILMFGIAMLVMGLSSSGTITCLIMVELANEVCKSIGYEKNSKFRKAILITILWWATAVDGIWPFARPVNLLVISMMQGYGYNINMGNFMIFSVAAAIIVYVINFVIVKFIMRPDTSKFMKYDINLIHEKMAENPLNSGDKIVMVSFCIVIIAWLIPSFKFLGVVSTYFSTLGNAGIAAIPILLLIFIKDKNNGNKPIFDYQTVWNKLPWALFIYVGTIMVFVANVSSKDYGIATWLCNLMTPVANRVSIWALIAIAMALTMVLTNFLSNTVTATVFLTAFLPVIMASTQINSSTKLVIAVLIAIFAEMAFLTQASCPSSGIMLSKDKNGEDLITVKEALPYNLCFLGALYLLGVLVLPRVLSIFF